MAQSLVQCLVQPATSQAEPAFSGAFEAILHDFLRLGRAYHPSLAHSNCPNILCGRWIVLRRSSSALGKLRFLVARRLTRKDRRRVFCDLRQYLFASLRRVVGIALIR
jgi:hypothetical protein